MQRPILEVLDMPDPDALHTFRLVEDWYFRIGSIDYMIPEDYIVNGASIPKPLRMIINPTGYLFLPSIPHDFAYEKGHLIELWRGMDKPIKASVSRIRVDSLFEEFATQLYPEKRIKTALAYQGLKVGGWVTWNACRAKD
jgi:hypothetical protein